jgi:hypothetical protein
MTFSEMARSMPTGIFQIGQSDRICPDGLGARAFASVFPLCSVLADAGVAACWKRVCSIGAVPARSGYRLAGLAGYPHEGGVMLAHGFDVAL